MDSLQHNPFPSKKEPESQQNQSGASEAKPPGTFADTIQQRFEASREGIRNHLALIGEIRQTIARLLELTRKSSTEGGD